MPKRPSKNVVQKLIEFPPEQSEEVQKFADARGESFRSRSTACWLTEALEVPATAARPGTGPTAARQPRG